MAFAIETIAGDEIKRRKARQAAQRARPGPTSSAVTQPKKLAALNVRRRAAREQQQGRAAGLLGGR